MSEKEPIFHPQDNEYRATEKVRPNQKGILRVILAFLMSLILPGLGQLFNSQPFKGVLLFLLAAVSWFFFLGWIVHILAAVDAALIALRDNLADDFDDPHSQEEGIPTPS